MKKIPSCLGYQGSRFGSLPIKGFQDPKSNNLCLAFKKSRIKIKTNSALTHSSQNKIIETLAAKTSENCGGYNFSKKPSLPTNDPERFPWLG